MSRETYVMRNGRCVPKQLAAPRIDSNDARVYVIGDVMAPAKHMATGEIYDSKARFRAATRAFNLTEVGTDPASRRDPGAQNRARVSQAEIVQDVKRALQELYSR